MREGRKEGKKEGRKGRKKEGRKGRKKEGRKEGRSFMGEAEMKAKKYGLSA